MSFLEARPSYFQESAQIPESSREPIRPLGKFSDAVVTEFPRLLSIAANSDGADKTKAVNTLGDEAETYAAEFESSAQFNPADPDSQLARLDVMLANRMVRLAGGPIGESLGKLVKTFSPSPYIPDATYGDLLFANRREDARTLSGDQREADFYFVHHDTEKGLHAFSTTLIDLLSDESEGYDPDKIANVMEATHHLDSLVTNMGMLRSKLTGFDGVIRPALMSIPEYPYHGPSGKDSATMYTVDILTKGRMLPSELFADIHGNRGYFYHPHLVGLDQAALFAVSDRSLLDRVVRSGFHPDLEELFITVSKRISRFRGIHTHAVEVHIPGALQGETDGSGGVAASDLKQFLLNRQAMHAKPELLIEALKQSNDPVEALASLKIT